MKKVFLFIVFTFSLSSYSQSIPMNGVLGLNCQNTVQSLDLWEGVNIHGLSYNRVMSSEERSHSNHTESFENRFKQLSKLYENSIGLMIDMAKWLPPFVSLNNTEIIFTNNLQINDREITTVEFYPPNCKLEYIGYSIPLPQIDSKEQIKYRFFIDQKLWNNLDQLNKKFVLSHFIFGTTHDDDYDDGIYSAYQRMRLINSLFLSDQLYNMTKEEYSDLTEN